MLLRQIETPSIVPRYDIRALWDERKTDILGRAQETNKPVGEVLNQLSPPSREDPGDAVARILADKGVQLRPTAYSPASRLSDFGYNRKHSEGRLLFNEYLDNRFKQAVLRLPLAVLEPDAPFDERSSLKGRYNDWKLERALSQTDTEQSGGQYWDRHYTADMIRSEQFGPSVDYRSLVYDVVSIEEDKYELPKLIVPENERRMQKVSRGAPPKLSNAGFDATVTEFVRYRGGVAFDDDFLANPSTRANVIEDFIMQFAEDFLIQLLHETARVYVANVHSDTTYADGTTYAHGTDHAVSTLTIGEWEEFSNSFPELYAPNRIIANPKGFRAVQDIYQPEQITVGMRRQTDPASTPNFYSLNDPNQAIGCALIKGKDSETNLNPPASAPNNSVSLIAYNLRYSGLVVVFKMGRDQDEMQRDAASEMSARYLGASVMFVPRDKTGIRRLIV